MRISPPRTKWCSAERTLSRITGATARTFEAEPAP